MSPIVATFATALSLFVRGLPFVIWPSVPIFNDPSFDQLGVLLPLCDELSVALPPDALIFAIGALGCEVGVQPEVPACGLPCMCVVKQLYKKGWREMWLGLRFQLGGKTG